MGGGGFVMCRCQKRAVTLILFRFVPIHFVLCSSPPGTKKKKRFSLVMIQIDCHAGMLQR